MPLKIVDPKTRHVTEPPDQPHSHHSPFPPPHPAPQPPRFLPGLVGPSHPRPGSNRTRDHLKLPSPSPSPTSPRPLRRRPSSPIPLRHRHGPVDVRLLGVITAAAGATVASTHALRGLLLVLAGEVLEVFDLVLYGWGFLLV